MIACTSNQQQLLICHTSMSKSSMLVLTASSNSSCRYTWSVLLSRMSGKSCGHPTRPETDLAQFGRHCYRFKMFVREVSASLRDADG